MESKRRTMMLWINLSDKYLFLKKHVVYTTCFFYTKFFYFPKKIQTKKPSKTAIYNWGFLFQNITF